MLFQVFLRETESLKGLYASFTILCIKMSPKGFMNSRNVWKDVKKPVKGKRIVDWLEVYKKLKLEYIQKKSIMLATKCSRNMNIYESKI